MKNTSMSFPPEIIENILSRWPVRYLMRCKLVSKQWKSIISDPRFAEIHLQRCKNSSCRNLVAWKDMFEYHGIHVAKLEHDKFRFIDVIQHPSEQHFAPHGSIFCYCDGLYLLKTGYGDSKAYTLWNPSTTKYIRFHCPYPIDNDATTETSWGDEDTTKTLFYGICKDPLMDDYKVVIADVNHYAFFSCRKKEWSELKAFRSGYSNDMGYCLMGVSFAGCCYWLVNTTWEGEEIEFEIICFESSSEKLTKLPELSFKGDNMKSYHLAPLGGHLCLFLSDRNLEEMKIMKKVDKGSWSEFKVVNFQALAGSLYFFHAQPICSINENEIIFDGDKKLLYLVYDCSQNTLRQIDRSRGRKRFHPIPYTENLFLQ